MKFKEEIDLLLKDTGVAIGPTAYKELLKLAPHYDNLQETVLDVQRVLGCTDTGLISSDVILQRIHDLQRNVDDAVKLVHDTQNHAFELETRLNASRNNYDALFERYIKLGVKSKSSDDWVYLDTEKPVHSGYYLVTVSTDDGELVQTMFYEHKKDQWIHEGEPTFCKGYFFKPIAWMTTIAPAKPRPNEEEHND